MHGSKEVVEEVVKRGDAVCVRTSGLGVMGVWRDTALKNKQHNPVHSRLFCFFVVLLSHQLCFFRFLVFFAFVVFLKSFLCFLL